MFLSRSFSVSFNEFEISFVEESTVEVNSSENRAFDASETAGSSPILKFTVRF